MTSAYFQDFVHYVCSACDAPEQLSETKLHKALWFIDTYAYRKYGRALSQGTYVKEATGPVATQLESALVGLKEEGSMHVHSPSQRQEGQPIYELAHLSPGTFLTEEERQLVGQIVNKICNDYSDDQISELSHDAVWESAEMGEEIPMSAVLAARPSPITAADIEWAKEEMLTIPDHIQAKFK